MTLQTSPEETKEANKLTTESVKIEDECYANHKLNLHSRLTTKVIKQYYSKKFSQRNQHQKPVKETTDDSNKIPTMFIENGEMYESQKDIVNLMSNQTKMFQFNSQGQKMYPRIVFENT